MARFTDFVTRALLSVLYAGARKGSRGGSNDDDLFPTERLHGRLYL